MSFKWNDRVETIFWNTDRNGEVVYPTSNKEVISNPYQAKFESILKACCAVLVELMEIEEKRSKVIDKYGKNRSPYSPTKRNKK